MQYNSVFTCAYISYPYESVGIRRHPQASVGHPMHTVICTGEEQHLMALECSGPPYLLYRRCLYTAAQLWLNESAMSFIETLLKILQNPLNQAVSMSRATGANISNSALCVHLLLFSSFATKPVGRSLSGFLG